MDYLSSILWYLSWPLFIFICYKLAFYAIHKLNFLK